MSNNLSYKWLTQAWLVLSLIVLSQLPGRAATLTVTNTNDSGPGSFRNIIAATATNDTVQFGVAGSINLTSAELAITHNLNSRQTCSIELINAQADEFSLVLHAVLHL